MPTLDWLGKKAVVNHHKDVPYRLVHCDSEFSAGDEEAGNLLVQGDNLEALKALLPYYAGKVKLIYIDPPYNTGNEGWVYNDNVNSPYIQKWLGETVGKEAEDLSRHDKWLCMMYPRLRLLKEFLTEDGAIFVSIDNNEVALLQLLMTEVFGNLFQMCIPVVNNMKGRNDRANFATCNEFLICVGMPKFEASGLPLSQKQRKDFKHLDVNGNRYALRDLRKRGGFDTRLERENLWFPLFLDEQTKKLSLEPFKNSVKVYPLKSDDVEGCWRWGEKRISHYIDTLIPTYVKKSNKWNISYRIYLNPEHEDLIFGDDPIDYSEDYDDETEEPIERTTKSKSFWWGAEISTDNAGKHLKEIFEGKSVFDYPKPIPFLERILTLATDKDSIILDSFAGSGTTGHAVLDLNKQDGGNRKFILVEMEEKIAQTVTSERLKRVINGYDKKKGDKTKVVSGLGGGFRFCTLGTPLFNEFGGIAPNVSFDDLAAHIFFSETGSPLPDKTMPQKPLIGTFEGRALYLLFVPQTSQDSFSNEGNVFMMDMLDTLPLPTDDFTGHKVVYASACPIDPDRLARMNITFRQIPYNIEGGF